MSANMAVASLCLVLVTLLAMVAAAVIAYCCWSGAFWWLEAQQQGEGRGAGGSERRQTNVPEEMVLARPAPRPPLCQDARPKMPPPNLPTGMLPGQTRTPWRVARAPNGSTFLVPPPMPAGGLGDQTGSAIRGTPVPCSASGLQFRGRGFSQQRSECVSVDSPSPRKVAPKPMDVNVTMTSRVVELNGRAQPMSMSARSVRGGGGGCAGVPTPARSAPQDLGRGYAAYLALKFGGNLSFHAENTDFVLKGYCLTRDDLCYCFLSLEEVASARGGGDLSLKKWGTGSFSARIWIVALARFVKAAQKHRGAKDDTLVQTMCDVWQYRFEHFRRELLSCEATFQQRHGPTLLSAFQQNDILHAEVMRARRVLAEHDMASGPRSVSAVRLALADSPVRPFPQLAAATPIKPIEAKVARAMPADAPFSSKKPRAGDVPAITDGSSHFAEMGIAASVNRPPRRPVVPESAGRRQGASRAEAGPSRVAESVARKRGEVPVTSEGPLEGTVKRRQRQGSSSVVPDSALKRRRTGGG